MNKLNGWLIILLNVFLFLIFTLFLCVFIPDLFKDNINKKDSYIAVFIFLVLMILSIYGFINGLKKVRTSKIMSIPYNKELNIQFNCRIEYKDYRDLIFGLSFKRPIFLIILGIILLNIINIFTNKNSLYLEKNLILPVILGIAFVFLIPIFAYFQTKMAYKSSKLFHENIYYSLDNNSIKMKGETFNSELTWNHFYKIKETKNFFMLYHGKMIANLLVKKNMNQGDVDEFRLFIKSLNVN